jgi:TP901 family phage tail tape measure protein
VALRTVGVKLTADVSQYMSAIGRAGAATKDFATGIDKASKAGHLDKVADRAGVVGLSLAGMAGYAIKAAADFDKAMSGVQAATHAGAKDISMLREAALQAGKDTQYSATQAADAITELSKAGVSTADVLNGGLKGALSLAAAGQLSVGEAAETAASAMTQFKLSGKDIPHIADLLAAGAGKAQGSVHDLGYALNQSGLVAHQFGLSVEDTTGTLAAFASAGLTGSDAGTSFKQMLLSLANPADKTKALMDDLGISAYDAGGKFVGITNLAEQLKTKLGGLTQAQRDAALAQIFGSDAIRTANVLYQQGAAGIQTWIDKVNDQGYAAETARIQTDNLAGDIERLKGSIETLAIQAGSGANGGLRVLVKAVNGLVNAFSELPPWIGSTITVMAALGGAALVLGAGWIKLRKTTAAVRLELEAMGPATASAAAGMGRLSAAAGKTGLVFAALQIAGEVVSHFQKDLNPQLDALSVGLEQYAKSGKTAGEASRVLGDNMGDLKKTFDLVADTSNNRKDWARNLEGGLEAIIPGLKGTNESLAKTQERIGAVDTALAQMVSGGNASGAQAAFDALSKELATNGVSLEEVRKQFPAYAAALETSKASTMAAATATGDLNGQLSSGAQDQKKYKTATEAATAATNGQRDALSQLSDMMKQETDPVFGLLKAQEGLADAQKAATKATKEHGASSKEAKQATRDLAVAAIGLQGAVGSLGQTFNGKMTPSLYATLRAAGLSKTEIKNLEGQFKSAKKAADQYDGTYEAKATAPGAVAAKKQLDDAYTAANHFAGPYAANLNVTGQGKVEAELRKLSAMQQALKSANTIGRLNGAGDGPGFAGGGWTGPGAKYQPAGVVHADEFVVNKSARAPLESAKPGALDYMNATGQWPGYAGGGMVWPYPVNASKTKVPSPFFSAPGGSGGPGYKWMEAAVRMAFPGMPIYSDYRPGAITLTGNKSYHGFGRAVDFAPSKPLAEWINLHFMRATKELITPWQSLNIHNGSRHRYSALIENQHNFAGGNAHDHWAMKNGGTITEPIFGVGASGRTYSFGENYQPERVTPMWQNAGSGGGGVTVVLENHGVIGSRMEVQGWLAASIDDLRRKGKI